MAPDTLRNDETDTRKRKQSGVYRGLAAHDIGSLSVYIILRVSYSVS